MMQSTFNHEMIESELFCEDSMLPLGLMGQGRPAVPVSIDIEHLFSWSDAVSTPALEDLLSIVCKDDIGKCVPHEDNIRTKVPHFVLLPPFLSEALFEAEDSFREGVLNQTRPEYL